MEQPGQLELQIWQEVHLTQPTAHLTGEKTEKATGDLLLLARIAVYTKIHDPGVVWESDEEVPGKQDAAGMPKMSVKP